MLNLVNKISGQRKKAVRKSNRPTDIAIWPISPEIGKPDNVALHVSSTQCHFYLASNWPQFSLFPFIHNQKKGSQFLAPFPLASEVKALSVMFLSSLWYLGLFYNFQFQFRLFHLIMLYIESFNNVP